MKAPFSNSVHPRLHVRRLLDLVWTLRRSALAAVEHDALTVGQATAYSGMIALFPALIVSAAIIGELPLQVPLRMQLAVFFGRILPSNVSPILDAYFSTTHRSPRTAGALLSAAIVSVTGAASVLVVFGHLLTLWLVGEVTPALRMPVYVVAFALRWGVALAGSVGIIAVVYHLGTDLSTHMRQHLEPLLREPWMALRKDWSWRASLPGAAVATVLWFVSTLLFGYYVTRFANYSQVYGSLGAAIALMFWLYIIALSVLMGAEFNAQRAAQGPGRRDPETSALLWKIPGLRFRRTGRMSD
jgi:membrane protein